MDLQPDLLSVILRLHTTEGQALSFLSQAIFSAVQSSYRPLEVLVVTQQFEVSQLRRIEQLLASFASGESCRLRTVNFQHPERRDHRSALLNIGITAAKGRYLAFLDYDDFVYGEAYSTLIGQLRRSTAAAAFGGCVVAHAIPSAAGYKTVRKSQIWMDKQEDDFLKGNIFPIHSFVIDRSRLKEALPRFNENSCHMEDYEFLMHLRLVTAFDLTCWKQMLVEYVVRDDGSNTLFVEEDQATPAKLIAWRKSYATLGPLRRQVTEHVQRSAAAS